MPRAPRLFTLAIIGGIAATVAGCQAEVEHGLDEHEANDVIVALEHQNISADKLKEEGGQVPSFTVTVPKGEKARAMEVLVANNLPRPRKDGIRELFPADVMIPTQINESMRKLAAQQNELAKSLGNIPNVLSANVNLNIPEHSELEEKSKPLPSASVIVIYQEPDAKDPTPVVTPAQIQAFVAKAVQDLTPENVSVILTKPNRLGMASSGEQFQDVLGLRMSLDSVGTFKGMASVMILGMMALAAWIGFLYWQRGNAGAPPRRSRGDA